VHYTYVIYYVRTELVLPPLNTPSGMKKHCKSTKPQTAIIVFYQPITHVVLQTSQ